MLQASTDLDVEVFEGRQSPEEQRESLPEDGPVALHLRRLPAHPAHREGGHRPRRLARHEEELRRVHVHAEDGAGVLGIRGTPVDV